MKIAMKNIVLSVLLLVLMGCSNWLDVNPRTEMKESELLSSEDGYKSALTGVYIQLAEAQLYGCNTSFYFTDLLARMWTVPSSSKSEVGYYMGRWDYSHKDVESLVERIWKGYYTCIAHLNEILKTVDQDQDLFQNGNYELIKGEALGLRGFLHLELLRLFGPVPGGQASGLPAIPYVEDLTKDPNKLRTLTYDVVIAKIIKDLDNAERYLEGDPIVIGAAPIDNWQSNRGYRFNYYAVKGAKARYYRWIGDAVKAAQYAQEVIDSRKFALATENDYASSGNSPANLVMLKEHLFGVHSQNHQNIIEPYFGGTDPLLTQSDYNIQSAYENITGDIRNVSNRYWQVKQSPDYWWITVNYFMKYMSSDDIESPNTIPVLRLAEMYFIVTESASQDVAESYFYQYLIARNITRSWVDDVADPELLKVRLEKEYRKEFWGEGQMWFWYKRWNYDKFTWPSSFTVPEDGYLIPAPQSQTMFD